jgi:hypothetical protein
LRQIRNNEFYSEIDNRLKIFRRIEKIRRDYKTRKSGNEVLIRHFRFLTAESFPISSRRSNLFVVRSSGGDGFFSRAQVPVAFGRIEVFVFRA